MLPRMDIRPNVRCARTLTEIELMFLQKESATYAAILGMQGLLINLVSVRSVVKKPTKLLEQAKEKDKN